MAVTASCSAFLPSRSRPVACMPSSRGVIRVCTVRVDTLVSSVLNWLCLECSSLSPEQSAVCSLLMVFSSVMCVFLKRILCNILAKTKNEKDSIFYDFYNNILLKMFLPRSVFVKVNQKSYFPGV